jgi:lysophospholipase
MRRYHGPMISEESFLPDLEPRFLPPQGWRWHEFTNAHGNVIRFGTVRPPGQARGVVVALPGLGEYCEKYFEVARDMLDRGLAFCVLDWCGQGRSSRPLSNRQKRHSTGFSNDVEDLHALICNPLSGVDPFAAGRLPAIMLAHSMGGNIGLRYLVAHGGIFDAAALCAPMLRIAAMRGLPGAISRRVSGFFAGLRGESYVFGAGDWKPLHRPPPPLSVLSADPVRCRVHNAWCLHDPRLQVGGVTFGWLHEANRSCGALELPGLLESISIPCLVAVAGRDVLVDPRAARRAAGRLPRGRLLDLPGCLHEILMERDVHRAAFFEKFDALLKETLKDCTV